MAKMRVERREDGVAVVWLDHPDKSVNTLSPDLVREFEHEAAPLLDDPAVRAIVVASAKQDTFIAGADLDVIEGLTAAEISAMSRDGNALLERIATHPKPVVAAVHGAALGGGLEVALACHYILASNDPATVLGQPEVQLGLLPAGGATQRLVERVGLTGALPLLLTGKRVRARRARRLGIVDAITTPGGIVDTACRAALALADGTLTRRPKKLGIVDRAARHEPVRKLMLKKAREQVERQTRGLYPAPPAILDCVETGLKHGRAAGLARESEYFGPLAVGSVSRSLVWLFHAMGEAKKEPAGSEPRPVHRLGVLGAGFMGAGVASVSLGLCPVVVRDLSDEALAAAAKTVSDGLAKQVRSDAISRTEADRRRSRLELTTDAAELVGSDLVVEAVFEDLDLKRRVLAELEDLLVPEAVIASNTSALPISNIAADARHPERVLGMHYFSPVPKMPLVEIVVTDRTAPWATATAHAFARAQGKTPIVVRDGPGFYTTRILAPYLNEAVLLLEEGARVEDVDRALKDFGFPVGPIALIDEVGIDVGAHVARDLGAAFADRGHASSDALRVLHEAGYGGRKNRRGFYQYPVTRRKGPKRVDDSVYDHLGGAQRRDIEPSEAAERLSLMMVNEAARCLEEGVVSSPRDGDLGAVLGLGFPPFRGGPFHHVDAIGAAIVVDRLHELCSRYGPRFQAAGSLIALAERGARFYPERPA
jgi:3-hydroxyacyl-CoA dehydrogenase/enoyl-CoA hydratase/carnithine racemase